MESRINTQTQVTPYLEPETEEHTSDWRDLFNQGRWAIITVFAAGILLHAMNIYFTAALMPTMVAEIGGDQYYAWVSTGFVTAAIISSMLVSRILIRFSTRTAYIGAFVLFAIGSLLIALSPSMEFVVVSRVIQGLGGGMMGGLAYALISSLIPSRLSARATGIVSAMWGVGTLLGPTLGGLFAQFDAWRLSYFIITGFSILFGILASFSLRGKTSLGGKAEPFPVLPMLLIVLATISLSLSTVFPVGWPTLLVTGIALIMLIAFAFVERRSNNTVLPASTYQPGSPLRWIYLTAMLLCCGVAIESFAPKFGQELGNLTPFLAGLLGAILSIGWTLAQLIIVSSNNMKIHRRALKSGPLILSIGLVAYGALQVANASFPVVLGWIGALLIAGVGIGISLPLMQIGAIEISKDPDVGPKAAASINTVQQIAFAISSAVAGLFVALGGTSPAAQASYLSLGMAVITLCGVVTAVLAGKAISQRAKDKAEKPSVHSPKNIIITISREFGSGGREFGKRLAEALGIAYYDKEIITAIAQKSGLAEEYVNSIVDKRINPYYPITIGQAFSATAPTLDDFNTQIYIEQNNIIEELALKSDCVIIGRCSDYILRDYNPFNIFIYADMEARLRRCRQRAPEDEHLSNAEMQEKVRSIDNERGRYYNFFTGQKWGAKENYTLCVNTSNTEIKDIVSAMAELLKAMPTVQKAVNK